MCVYIHKIESNWKFVEILPSRPNTGPTGRPTVRNCPEPFYRLAKITLSIKVCNDHYNVRYFTFMTPRRKQ